MSFEKITDHSTNNSGIDDMLHFAYFWIGPVQEFIQEARKVHDLFIGSRLLAATSYEVMKVLVKNSDSCKIILPDTQIVTDNDFSHLPNHCIATIKQSEFRDIVNEIERTVSRFLSEIADQSIINTHIPDILEKFNQKKKWDDQINKHLQLYWVSLKATQDDLDTNYPERYRRLQQLMEERKLTRNFQEWDGYHVDKCNQCGHREILGENEKSKNNDFWKAIADEDTIRFKIKENEKLCAVCMLKRILKSNTLSVSMSDSRFDSTSDVSSQTFRNLLSARVQDAETFLATTELLSEAVNKSSNKLSRQEQVKAIPGDWLYPEGLQYKRLNKDYSFPEAKRAKAENTLRALNDLYSTLEEKPCKYYALMAFDGDNMGKYLSGLNMLPDTVFSKPWQYKQSELISKLAKSLPGTINETWQGQTIYSGGDDYLAIGPLEGVLTTIEKIRTEFISNFDNNLTISAAIVIAHHQDNLQKVIGALRESLNRAKEINGPRKDTLVVTVRISSGNTISCGYHWGLPVYRNHEKIPFVSGLLKTMADWMRDKTIGLSPAFLYQLTRESDSFYRYTDRGSVELDDIGKEMFRLEAKRLFVRHISKENNLCPESIKRLLDTLEFAAYPAKGAGSQLGFNAQDNFYSLLAISRFLARQKVYEL